MERERYKRIYDLHSWSGIALGLFLYVIAFTGCIALFDHEIKTWEDPARRLPVAENPVPIDPIFNDWIEQNKGENEVQFLLLNMPTEFEPYYLAYLQTVDENRQRNIIEQRWNPHTGEPLADRGDGLSHWLLDFHRNLMWPDSLGGTTVGRSLVGIAGIVMMLSIITGILAHKKIIQELFSLRYMRSIRLKWQDTHKVLGLWGLPFFATISFTGAYLGIVTMLAPIVAVLAFKGDQEALFAAVLGQETEPTGVVAEMISLDHAATIRHPESGNLPFRIIIDNWGDETAEFELFYEADTELAIIEEVGISGVTGEVLEVDKFHEVTPSVRVSNAIAPLHYGTYGGFALKLLYFALGLVMVVVTALGLVMWLERRVYGGEQGSGDYKKLSSFFAGTTTGLPVATVSVFYLDKLYTGVEDARLYWTVITYFLVWLGGVAYAFVRRNDYRTVRELLLLAGVMLVGVPIVNATMTGDLFLNVFSMAHKVPAYVDITILVIGIITIAASMRLPVRRIETVRRKQQVPAE